MDTSRISKIASHLSIVMAVGAFLFASTVVRADDNQNKKNKTTTQSGSSGQKSSSSGSGGSHSNGNTGKTHNNSGSATSSSGASVGSHSTGSHKHDNNTSSTNSTGAGGTGSSTSSSNDHKHKTGTGGSTGSTGSSVGTSGDSSTSHNTGKHDKNRTTDVSGAGTGSGTTSTNTSGGKGNKHGGSSASDTTGTTTSGKSGKVTTANVNPGFVRSSNGKPEIYRARDGSEARFRRDGTIREVHTRDMTIIHRPGIARTVIVERPDRSVIVVNHFGHGYVQRPFLYRNHEFYNRTYYYRGRPYALYYRGYPYRGIVLRGYVPYRYYNPAFYGWTYRPWYRPVRYSWGWFGSPWYGYYGRYYFTPYSVYPSASFWLTDFLIATSLQAAYEERLANQASSYSSYSSGPSGSVLLTPEVKDAISNEVQRQLALENSESRIATSGDLDMNSSGLPRMLAEASPSNPRIFVVAGSVDVTDSKGQECTLTEGDVLRLSSPPPSNASSAILDVLATKNQSCPKGSAVSVGFADLQEMQNHMRATIDRGLQDLQEHQGGLPAPPANAAAAPVQASFAPIAPPPDPNVTSELQGQALQADAADRQLLTEVNQADSSTGAGSSAEPAEISLGQTTSEVEAILGKPKQSVNLGSKKVYVYPSMKITFINGKVSDVQ